MPHCYKLKTLFLLAFFLTFLPYVGIALPTTSAAVAPELKAVPSLHKAISLRWEPVAGSAYYVIEYKSGGADFMQLATVQAPLTVYRHTGLGYGQQVQYRIKSVDTGGVASAYSATATATTHAAGYTYRIMPMGDSNTHGTKNGDTRPDSEKIAYRKDLYRLLSLHDISFDFVGSQKAGQDYLEDPDNAGFPGARDEDLADILEKGWHYWYCASNCGESDKHVYADGPYLNEHHPDIILLHIGTNWIDPNGERDVARILDLIDAYEEAHDKEVTVVLARILQRVENTTPSDEKAFTTIYNNKVEALARERIRQGDRIVLVDMENGAGINYQYTYQGGDMEDNLHPSASGYGKMARVWFDALKTELELQPKPFPITVVPSLYGALSVNIAGAEQGETDYVIESSTKAEGPFVTVAKVQATLKSFRHEGLGNGETRYYRVKALLGAHQVGESVVASATTKTASTPIRIMPMGDSNTHGHDTDKVDGNNFSLPIERQVSYRRRLAELLKEQDINFQFVGSMVSGESLLEYPNHAGFPGARDEDIVTLLKKGSFTPSFPIDHSKGFVDGPYLDVPAHMPDIILLHIGTNWVDGTPEGMRDLEALLNEVDAHEQRMGREVTVVLAKIINRVPYENNAKEIKATADYNSHMEELVAARKSRGDRIHLVDMAAAGLQYTWEAPFDMSDTVHPSQSGYDKLAPIWMSALNELLEVVPLPVELVSFGAKDTEDGPVLNWKTASEQNNSHFEVERRSGKGEFQLVGSVNGMGTTSLSQHYSFVDEAAPAGTLYYRLRQVDFDGRASYSKIVAVQRTATAGRDAVFPNPMTGNTMTVKAHGLPEGIATVSILSAMGKQVYQTAFPVSAAGLLKADLTFPQPLSPGIYIVQVGTLAQVYSRMKVLVH